MPSGCVSYLRKKLSRKSCIHKACSWTAESMKPGAWEIRCLFLVTIAYSLLFTSDQGAREKSHFSNTKAAPPIEQPHIQTLGLSRAKLYTPPLPQFLAMKHFLGEGGGGVYFEAPRGRNFIRPPLYTPHPWKGICGGWACMKFGPPRSLDHGSRPLFEQFLRFCFLLKTEIEVV